MLQSGHINFFNVDKCGLYSFAGKNPVALTLPDTFKKLTDWAEGRTFETTNPWDPKKNKNKTPCYCHKVHFDKVTGDYLLVLWKGENDKHGPLYGMTIAADGKPESKPIKQADKPKKGKVVWGRPCYYWVIPETQCIASIKFENSRCDSNMFQDWVAGSMNFRVDLPEYKKVTTDTGLVRLQFSEDENHPYKYYYQFDLSLRTLSTSSAPLKELEKKVTHIIRKETVSLNVKDERKGWVKTFGEIVLPYASNKDSKSRKVELTVEARPTVEEIKDIIERFGSTSDNADGDDVGFVLDNGRTVWAKQYRHSETFSIDDDGNDILDAEHLYATLSANRSRYLAPILKDIRAKKTGTGK